MGIGSSREYGQPRLRRRSPPSRYGRQVKQKRRRSFLQRGLASLTTQSVIPIKHHSPHLYGYGSSPYILPPFSPLYSGYMPSPYNNYPALPYAALRQPFFIPPMPILQPQPVMIPQPMAAAQQIPSPLYSPYISSPYATGAPVSTPYVPQQSQVPPVYNVGGASVPIASMGATGPTGVYSTPYQSASRKLSTDWTGGGMISPGFLGPPI